MINKIKEKYNDLKTNTKRYMQTAKDAVHMTKETIDAAKMGYKVIRDFNNLNKQYAKGNSNDSFSKGYYKTNNASKSTSYKKDNLDIDNKNVIDVEFEEI